MRNLYLQLTVSYLLLLTAVLVTGLFINPLGAYGNAFDVLVAIAVLFSVTVHSITYTYFIAASKFAQRAVEEHGVGTPALIEESKACKRKGARYLYMAMFAAMGAVFVYFWSLPDADGSGPWRGWALLAGIGALIVNAMMSLRVMKYVEESCVLNDGILAQVPDVQST